MQRILITGSNGLLGQKVVELFSRSSNYNLLLTSRQNESVFDDETLAYRTLDTTNKQEVRKVIDEIEPNIIIHTAALTDVDRCEVERDLAWRANVTSVEHLVHAAKMVGARIVHISTDYVFDGKQGPYDELARPNPLSYYGRTKLASENVLRTGSVPHAIVRTMVLYGVGYGVKLNFALWVVKNLSEGKPIRVVDDQIGNPTLVDDLAYAIVKIVELGRSDLYHVAGADCVSRYDFALALAKEFDFPSSLITPVKTASLKQAAPRPLRSGFVTLHAETDLGFRPAGIQQGARIFKNQLKVSMRQMAHHTH